MPPELRRDLPESGDGRWGEGLTAEDMKRSRRLKPRLAAVIEVLNGRSITIFVIRSSSGSVMMSSRLRSRAKYRAIAVKGCG